MTGIETLLAWSAPVQVVTKRGDRLLRKARPTPEFEALYRERRREFNDLGITLGDYRGKREVCWWSELPAAVVQERSARIEASRATDADVDLPIADGYAYKGYQRAGIVFALDCFKRVGGCLLADDMGLGKTLQAIGVISTDTKIQRVLVICPNSLKLNWHRELKRFLARPLSIGVADSKCFPTTDIVILNYESAYKWEKSLTFYWDLLILDEAHRIKNPDTRTAKSIIGFRPKKNSGEEPKSGIPTRRKLALTGTPIQNRPMEIFTILNWIDPVRWKNRFKFGLDYCGGRRGYGGSWDFSGASNVARLQQELRSSFVIRRLKSEVLTELPPKQRQLIILPSDNFGDLLKEQRQIEDRLAAMRAQKGQSRDYSEAVSELSTSEEQGEAFRIAHEVALAKVPLVTEHVTEALEEGGKIILFAHHLDVIAAYVKAFKAFNPVRITGEDSIVERQRSVDRFQQDPACRIVVAGIQAAKEGLTLTASSHVVFAEIDWVPGTMCQCEDRCILEGQEVLTPEGWRPIESIKVGEKVIGQDGLPHNVTDAWSRKAKGAYSSDTKTIVTLGLRGWFKPMSLTSDHRVLTTSGWVEAGNLKPGHRIKMPEAYECSLASVPFDEDCRIEGSFIIEPTIRSNGKSYPLTVMRNARLIKAPNDIELTADAMFCFGYYLGDGFAATGKDKGRFVSLSGNNGKKTASLQRCKSWFESHGVNAFLYERDGEKGNELRCFSGEWANWFSKHFGRILTLKSVPEWVFRCSTEMRLAFIEGMAESDGYRRKGRTEIVTAIWRIASDVSRLLMSIGRKPCVTVGSKGQFSVSYSDSEPQEICVQTVSLRLANKTERVHDLTVEGSSTFVVGTSVVHNCHRIGQPSSVLVQHLVLEGSVDVAKVQSLVRKQEIIEQALDRRAAGEQAAATLRAPIPAPRPNPAPARPRAWQSDETGQLLLV